MYLHRVSKCFGRRDMSPRNFFLHFALSIEIYLRKLKSTLRQSGFCGVTCGGDSDLVIGWWSEQ